MEAFHHEPVMLNEVLEWIQPRAGGVYCDGTLGGGGHSGAILRAAGSEAVLYGIDRDESAIAAATERLGGFPGFHPIHGNFHDGAALLAAENAPALDGVLLDLGVSSHQFDTPERGFSFRWDAPLDMRMNTRAPVSAADVVNGYEAADLERILRLYGEVDKPGKTAALIVAARGKARIATTGDLHKALEPALPKAAEHKFLAKIYQALRIEVNQEMRSLEKFLKALPAVTAPGGRLAIITYHSLEDRMVKNFIKTGNVEGRQEKDSFGRLETPFEALDRKPILPTEDEIQHNTRARSAKLRTAVRV